jgi:hypothetical protein
LRGHRDSRRAQTKKDEPESNRPIPHSPKHPMINEIR